MHGELRATLARWLTIVAIAATGCRDASGPAAELELRVSPDTVRIDPTTSAAQIAYTIRSTADVDLLIPFFPEVQQEVSPGSWTTLVDPNESYITSTLGGIAVPSGYVAQGTQFRQLIPGRYRLRATYRRLGTTGVTNPNPSVESLSNIFTVLR